MRSQILYAPTYSLLQVQLETGEQVVAEGGAMVSMSGGINIETGTRGGVFAGLKRAVLGGESFFVNTFTAGEPGEVNFAPPLSGDLVEVQVDGQQIMAQSGSFIASTPAVQVDTGWGGARGFFSGAGIILLKLGGSGTVWLSSYGAMHLKTLDVGERYVVDTGHIVAFEASTSYSVRRVGGLKSMFFSGEGLVAEFTGPGRIWLQTRSTAAFLDWLVPKLPRRSNND